jgi:hypothetical protein
MKGVKRKKKFKQNMEKRGLGGKGRTIEVKINRK